MATVLLFAFFPLHFFAFTLRTFLVLATGLWVLLARLGAARLLAGLVRLLWHEEGSLSPALAANVAPGAPFLWNYRSWLHSLVANESHLGPA